MKKKMTLDAILKVVIAVVSALLGAIGANAMNR
ncbi:smalltalk protein [Bacteroides sp. UBA939]|nr:smalltalk protein [Bacteroides sp. UBA939]